MGEIDEGCIGFSIIPKIPVYLLLLLNKKVLKSISSLNLKKNSSFLKEF